MILISGAIHCFAEIRLFKDNLEIYMPIYHFLTQSSKYILNYIS